jgi:hypothetical protein
MPTPARQPDGGHQLPALASPNPLAVERRVLRTRLSPAECIERLDAETVRGGPADRWITTDKRLRGTVGRDTVFVRRFTPDHRNVGRPYLSGTLTQDGNGTRIALTIAPQIGFRIFSLVALVGVAAFAIFSVATGFIRSTVPINDGESQLPVPWLLVILAAIFVIGPYVLKRVGVSEGPWLLDFLTTLLEARLDSPGDPAMSGGAST